MTRLERAFLWVGGALFVVSLLSWIWWYVVVLSRFAPWSGWGAVIFDTALFGTFALHHSFFARDRVKAALPIPHALIKSVYVWTASLLLIAVCVFWSPIGGELYETSGPIRAALAVVQLLGVLVIARAVARIDALELAGIRPPDAATGLQVGGPYRWVRHPVYFGWTLFVFGAGRMTGDRLVFAVISSLYLAIAVPWEERSLIQSFGDDYLRYKDRVRWRMLPFVY
jgi:methanethiol S-methyltransferase